MDGEERVGGMMSGNLSTLTNPTAVIPAKAGIHGLNCRFMPLSPFVRMGAAMDSRLRGNDEVLFGEIGFGRRQQA
jgi:hypothetical protein